MIEQGNSSEYLYRQGLLKWFIEKQGNKIPFDVFMDESLYGRSESFYEQVNIGKSEKQSDFWTFACSPLYAELIGRHVLRTIDDKSTTQLFLELAGGMGTFKENLLIFMSKYNIELDYISLDHSLHLLRKQAEFGGKNYRGSALQLPFAHNSIRGTVFMNELFDNLPFKVTRLQQSKYKKLVVEELLYELHSGKIRAVWETTGDERLHTYWNRQLSHLNRHFAYNPSWDLPASFISTVNLNEESLVKELFRVVAPGSVVIIADYGYTLHPGIFSNTDLFSPRVYPSNRHRKITEMYHLAYNADITAHVNFTNVMAHAEDAGFKIEKIAAQKHFLWEVITKQEEQELREQQEHHPWYKHKRVFTYGGTNSGRYILILTK